MFLGIRITNWNELFAQVHRGSPSMVQLIQPDTEGDNETGWINVTKVYAETGTPVFVHFNTVGVNNPAGVRQGEFALQFKPGGVDIACVDRDLLDAAGIFH